MRPWRIRFFVLLVPVLLLLPVKGRAFWGVGDIVFDPSNFANTLDTAVRLLKVVGIAQDQLEKIETNLQKLEGLLDVLRDPDLSNLQKLEAVSANADGLSYAVDTLEASYSATYPDFDSPVDRDRLKTLQKRWLEQTRESIEKAMAVQGAVQDLPADREDLADALTKARAAEGNLQIGQSQAEIDAIMAKQLMRLEHMLAVSQRAQSAHLAEQNALERARARYHEHLMEGFGDPSPVVPMSTFP